VHGGEYSTAVVTSQLLCLDLTKPWNTSNPPWNTLTPSPFVNSYHTATYSPDKKTLFFLGFNSGAKPGPLPQNFLNSYSVATDTWQPGNPAIGVTDKDRRDFQGALDPTTGRYMFLGGNFGILGATKSNFVNVFDTQAGSFISENVIPFIEYTAVQGNVVGYVGQGAHQGLYSLAGEVNNGSSTSTSLVPMSMAYIYSTSLGQWTTAASNTSQCSSLAHVDTASCSNLYDPFSFYQNRTSHLDNMYHLKTGFGDVLLRVSFFSWQTYQHVYFFKRRSSSLALFLNI